MTVQYREAFSKILGCIGYFGLALWCFGILRFMNGLSGEVAYSCIRISRYMVRSFHMRIMKVMINGWHCDEH